MQLWFRLKSMVGRDTSLFRLIVLKTEVDMTMTQRDLSSRYTSILLMTANKPWRLKLKPCVVRSFQHVKQFHLALYSRTPFFS